MSTTIVQLCLVALYPAIPVVRLTAPAQTGRDLLPGHPPQL